jgi:hypothetical protein
MKPYERDAMKVWVVSFEYQSPWHVAATEEQAKAWVENQRKLTRLNYEVEEFEVDVSHETLRA